MTIRQEHASYEGFETLYRLTLTDHRMRIIRPKKRKSAIPKVPWRKEMDIAANPPWLRNDNTVVTIES